MRRVLLVLGFVVAACGVKGSPRPPRTDSMHEAPVEPADAGCATCGATPDAGAP